MLHSDPTFFVFLVAIFGVSLLVIGDGMGIGDVNTLAGQALWPVFLCMFYISAGVRLAIK
jgi:hypothetical protein